MLRRNLTPENLLVFGYAIICTLNVRGGHTPDHLDSQTVPIPRGLLVWAVGDWGGTDSPPFTTREQRRIARVMSARAEMAQPPQLILSLGDNMYALHYGELNGRVKVRTKQRYARGINCYYAGIDEPCREDEQSARFQRTFEDVYVPASRSAHPHVRNRVGRSLPAGHRYPNEGAMRGVPWYLSAGASSTSNPTAVFSSDCVSPQLYLCKVVSPTVVSL